MCAITVSFDNPPPPFVSLINSFSAASGDSRFVAAVGVGQPVNAA
jgi:hypothetical protein